MRNGFHTVFLYAMVNTVKQFLNLKSFPSRPRPSPPFLPLNANLCGLEFPFRANRFTRGRISALLKIPLSRAEWNPFRKNFTIRFLSISAPLPRQVPIRKKMSALRIVAARLCHSAILTRTIRLRAAPFGGLAKSRRSPATETRLFFTAKLQFLASDSALPMYPQLPTNSAPCADMGEPAQDPPMRNAPTRRGNTTLRGIKGAQKHRRNFLPVPPRRARMLSVVDSAARARSPSAYAALIKQISHTLGAK